VYKDVFMYILEQCLTAVDILDPTSRCVHNTIERFGKMRPFVWHVQIGEFFF